MVCITALPLAESISFEKAVPSDLSPSHWTDYISTEGDLAPCEPAEIFLCLWVNYLQDTYVIVLITYKTPHTILGFILWCVDPLLQKSLAMKSFALSFHSSLILSTSYFPRRVSDNTYEIWCWLTVVFSNHFGSNGQKSI